MDSNLIESQWLRKKECAAHAGGSAIRMEGRGDPANTVCSPAFRGLDAIELQMNAARHAAIASSSSSQPWPKIEADIPNGKPGGLFTVKVLEQIQKGNA